MALSRTIIPVDSEVTATVRSIKDIIVTYDTANGTTLYADHGKQCSWFAIQNKNAGNSLFLQSDDDSTVGGNGNVEISPSGYYQAPPCSEKYDLDEEFIRVSTNNQLFSLNVKWG